MKVLSEKKKMLKATPTLVELCSNGGFEQFESVGEKAILRIFYFL
jgi:hypothetical protein